MFKKENGKLNETMEEKQKQYFPLILFVSLWWVFLVIHFSPRTEKIFFFEKGAKQMLLEMKILMKISFIKMKKLLKAEGKCKWLFSSFILIFPLKSFLGWYSSFYTFTLLRIRQSLRFKNSMK